MTIEESAQTTYKNSVTWRSPSNIAIVKYWGKLDRQIPMNASISMTLSEACTQTTIDYRIKNNNEPTFEFFFNKLPQPSFEPKLINFFKFAFERFSILTNYHFKISSSNTFPHSAGIASSASSMSALALCITQINKEVTKLDETLNLLDAGELARLGSGSACRSVYGGWTLWGMHDAITESSDNYAIELNDKVNPVFKNYADTILVIDENKKSVSSTAGHQLMNNHPYKQGRLEQAKRNIDLTIEALTNGDTQLFNSVCEEEALSLHALMMSSNPGFILLKSQTLAAIDKIRDFRQQSHIPICFTLDAGPNIHLLYPMSEKQKVMPFIETELKPLCKNQHIIQDRTGSGPQQLI
jgi:diphosphomevalonate decarboxylase